MIFGILASRAALFRTGLAVLAIAGGPAPAAFPTLAIKPLCLDQLQSPTTVTNAGDGSGRLFICEQRGKILIFKDGMLQPTPFLDLGSKLVSAPASYDERGLLGLTFHPGYANPASPGFGRFYVNYNKAYGAGADPQIAGMTGAPNCVTVIAEYRVSTDDPNIAEANSERRLLTYTQPQNNHNGGQIEFGPDGYLYIGVGDGGGQNDNRDGHTRPAGSPVSPPVVCGYLGNGQDRRVLLGKILRIDPLGNNGPGGQYGIPIDNPFVGQMQDASDDTLDGPIRGEIYAFGMRNPWRFSFDTGPGATGRLFCADVGQDKAEEVDIITKGGNYGWRIREGGFDHDPSAPNPSGIAPTDPIAQYAHTGTTIGSPALPQIGNSITGGYVYRGAAFPAGTLQGKYIFADWGRITPIAAGTLLGLEETSPGTWVFSVLDVTGGNPVPTHISAFGRDEQGEIYFATKTNTSVTANDPSTGKPAGGLYKIVPPAPGSVVIEASRDTSIFEELPGNASGYGPLTVGIAATAGLNKRRTLLAFDLTGALPPRSVVTSAQLSLFATAAAGANQTLTLHRLLEDWGEAASMGEESAPAEPGDATWTHAFNDPTLPITWGTPGGAYAAGVSASAPVGGSGTQIWSGGTLLSDVQSWLASPFENFGWLLRDATETSASPVLRRFASRHDPVALNRPRLKLTYTGAAMTHREQWLQRFYSPGTYVADAEDTDQDGLVAQVEYALGTSPLEKDATVQGVEISTARVGANDVFTLTFRRDPRATDLTYQLQTSEDLENWNTIVQSVSGTSPTGMGFAAETDIVGEPPLRLVIGRETFPPGRKRFARLRVLRSP